MIQSDFCPTQEQLAGQYLMLLPRGRAWAEGGPGRESGGVIHAVIEALASVFAHLHAEICTLALELFCATATLTLDLWNLEYGLPDGCDPYQDVCDKIAAFGAPLCATYQTIAATLGWSISCGGSCGSEAGCAEAGCSVFGPVDGPGVLIVAVDLAKSSAYVGAPETIAEFGCFEHGLQPSCGVDLRSLDCMLQRIVGAHVELVYAVSDFPVVAPPPPSPPVGVTVNDSGATTYLKVASQTPADSPLITFSAWFRLYDLTQFPNLFDIWKTGPGARCYLSIGGDGTINVALGDNAASINRIFASSASGAVTAGAWHHIFMSGDMNHAPGARPFNLYLDGISLAPTLSTDAGAAFAAAMNGFAFAIPSNPSGDGTKVDLYDFWLASGQYLDATNLTKFRTSGGAPVALGSNGQAPTGTPPTYFFHDGVPAFATNLGSGDAPVLTGTLAAAPSPAP